MVLPALDGHDELRVRPVVAVGGVGPSRSQVVNKRVVLVSWGGGGGMVRWIHVERGEAVIIYRDYCGGFEVKKELPKHRLVDVLGKVQDHAFVLSWLGRNDCTVDDFEHEELKRWYADAGFEVSESWALDLLESFGEYTKAGIMWQRYNPRNPNAWRNARARLRVKINRWCREARKDLGLTVDK